MQPLQILVAKKFNSSLGLQHQTLLQILLFKTNLKLSRYLYFCALLELWTNIINQTIFFSFFVFSKLLFKVTGAVLVDKLIGFAFIFFFLLITSSLASLHPRYDLFGMFMILTSAPSSTRVNA